MDSTSQAIEEFFHRALAATLDERILLLASLAPADRARVGALLAAHEASDGFFHISADAITESEAPGTQVDRYILTRQIGEGGFAVVFAAEQSAPVRRTVALKIIKPGMDSRQVIARFNAERQALAMMDHPHIAKVFDAGTTGVGRPYFVMELVVGVPITQYCDREQLSIPRRLRLFAQVCQAVQHAHSKGLIHRDLKPSNILVATHDGEPLAKIIDFGIAKATGQHAVEGQTLFTTAGQFIGTPEYMSPEQAGALTGDVDTRSDVYSLGVLLYELLTSETPFDARQLRSHAHAEMQRLIREVEPARPSMKIRQQPPDTRATSATQRRVEPRKLDTIVRGELDWIVMKCLEKDPARRYETASALAGDVLRYIAHEPVLAAPPSRWYRLRTFVRRNRVAVAVATALLLLLLGGTTGTAIGLVGQSRQRRAAEWARQEAERQRVEAERQAAEATRQYDIASAVIAFQREMFGSADSERMGDRTTVLDAVRSAAKQVDAGKLKDQPIAEANVREMIGDTLSALGHIEEAETNYRRAMALRLPQFSKTHPSYAKSLYSLATALTQSGKLQEAEFLFREALSLAEQLNPPQPAMVAEYQDALGMTVSQLGRLDDAEQLIRQAIEVQRSLLKPSDPTLIDTLSDLARVQQHRGQYAKAEASFRDALARERSADPARPVRLLNQIQRTIPILRLRREYAQAELLLAEAIALAQSHLTSGHPDMARLLGTLGSVERAQGKLPQAIGHMREALKMQRAILPPDHWDLLASESNLGEALASDGQYSEAEPLLADAAQGLAKVYGADGMNTGRARNEHGHVLTALKRFQAAEDELQEAERIYRISADGAARSHHEECVKSLIELYEAWDASEPDAGHRSIAQYWRGQLRTDDRIPATSPTMTHGKPSHTPN